MGLFDLLEDIKDEIEYRAEMLKYDLDEAASNVKEFAEDHDLDEKVKKAGRFVGEAFVEMSKYHEQEVNSARRRCGSDMNTIDRIEEKIDNCEDLSNSDIRRYNEAKDRTKKVDIYDHYHR